jgi:sec-independent protein translocase protein TatA
MEFFGMGPLEILVILIVGLIAFGPGKIPEFARNLGKGIAALKKATGEFTAEVSKELDVQEKDKNKPSKPHEAKEQDAGSSER